MSPLQSALDRLYFASEPIRQNGNTQTPAGGAADGRVRAMVLEYAKPADLAGIFTDEPWLDLEPTPDAQIRLLSRLECIQPAAAAATSPVAPVASEPPTDWAAPSAIATHAKSLGPKGFLMDVMNDPTVPLPLRIEAAKALLPYVEAGSSNLQ